MKKLKNLLFTTLFIVLSLFTFTACKQSPYKSLDVSYSGVYDYDMAKNVIMVEYGKVINLTLDDFNATVTFENGKSKKTDKVTMDASSVNHKAPAVGDYKIYFSYQEQTDKFEMTVRVYEKSVTKPYLESFKTTYSGQIVNVENYILGLPAFNSEYMEIEKSGASTISATNAGDYKVYIALKPGYVWNTATGKYTAIEFTWKIEKKKISIPTINGESVFTYKFDANYDAVMQSLLFDEVEEEKSFYIISNNSASLAENYTASVKIKDQFKNNYCFADQTSEKTFDYQILPYELDKVALADSGRYTFSGEAIAPNLSNFIEKIMTKSDFSNNINASSDPYTLIVELKPEHKTNYVWKGENSISAVRILYEIQKRYIERPELKQSEYTYTGKAIAPEFVNLDKDLEISDTSANIGVGTYQITVKLKENLIPSNYTLQGADSASSIVYNYTIVARKYMVSLSWDKPENATYTGSTQFVTLFITGDGVENFKLKTNYKYYLKDAEGNYNEVDNLIYAGEYKIVATLAYDDTNNILRVNENPPREILESDLKTELVVAKAKIDCSSLALSKSTPMYTGSAITPRFTEINNLTISKEYEIYQNDQKVESIINAGSYTVKISVSYDENNYKLVNFTDEFVLTVKPKTISKNIFSWDYKEAFTYDMTEKTVSLVCSNKDYTFLVITYENNKETDPGTYTATATVSLPEDQTNYSLNTDATSFSITFEIVRGEPILKVKYGDYEFYFDQFTAGVDTNFTLTDDGGYYKAKIVQEGITSLEKIRLYLSGTGTFNTANYPNEYGYCDLEVKDADGQSSVKHVNIHLEKIEFVFVIELYEPSPVSIKIGEKSFGLDISGNANTNNDFDIIKDESGLIIESIDLALDASDFDIEGKTEIEITFTFLNDQVGISDKTYIFTTDKNATENLEYPAENVVDVSTLDGTLSATLTVSIDENFITLYMSIEFDDGLYLYSEITIAFL